MNYIVPFTNYCKNFIWNIFHSLINYFFYLHVKKQHNINQNCYLFISKIGLRNRILINYINYGNNQYFEKLELKNIKLEINNNKKIPIIYVKNITVYPKIFTLTKMVNMFKIWNNANKDTISKMLFFESIYNEFIKYVLFKSFNITIFYKNFKLEIHNYMLTKNNNKIRIFIKRIRIFYNDQYICKLNNFKISYDLVTNNINIYAKNVSIIIDPEFIRHNVYAKLSNLIKELSSTDDNKLPNIYFNNFKIILNFQNYTSIHIKQFCLENNIAKCDANITLWKKEILWINNILFNMNSNICIINDIRLRLFTSSCDKIYKSFRPIIKKYFFTKTKTNTRNQISKFKKPIINISYCSSLINSVINSPNYVNNTNINYSYIAEHEYGNYMDFIIIKKFKIDFEDNNGTFLFDNFKYASSENGFSLSSKKWLFFKDNIRYLDTLDNRDIIKFEFKNNSMYIHTYKLYLNLDIDQYSKTFYIFARSIDRIIDIFTFQKSNKTYIFDKFYMCSFRSIFSYSPSSIDFTNLFTGNYNELLNLLDLSDMDIILKDNTISYPQDFKFILNYLIKNIIEDVIDNNFETVIKKTPVALTYKLKKVLSKFPKYATKVYNTINANI